jgi:hypothetical protein
MAAKAATKVNVASATRARDRWKSKKDLYVVMRHMIGMTPGQIRALGDAEAAAARARLANPQRRRDGRPEGLRYVTPMAGLKACATYPEAP